LCGVEMRPLRVVHELRAKTRTHFLVPVKDGMGYFLCRGFEQFGKFTEVDKAVNCKLCNRIQAGRNLEIEQVYNDMEI